MSSMFIGLLETEVESIVKYLDSKYRIWDSVIFLKLGFFMLDSNF